MYEVQQPISFSSFVVRMRTNFIHISSNFRARGDSATQMFLDGYLIYWSAKKSTHGMEEMDKLNSRMSSNLLLDKYIWSFFCLTNWNILDLGEVDHMA